VFQDYEEGRFGMSWVGFSQAWLATVINGQYMPDDEEAHQLCIEYANLRNFLTWYLAPGDAPLPPNSDPASYPSHWQEMLRGFTNFPEGFYADTETFLDTLKAPIITRDQLLEFGEDKLPDVTTLRQIAREYSGLKYLVTCWLSELDMGSTVLASFILNNAKKFAYINDND
jgi:hypothetical protein